MEVKDLKVLFDLICETDITEFEMENSDEKIVIRRGACSAQPAQQPVAPVVSAPVVSDAASCRGQEAASAEETGGVAIKSPIVGTFYSAPEPGAAPYVEVGHVVEKGQMLCIVEAMKLMNEIEAEFRCRILKSCKENAQAVEFGDTLFMVERL